MLDKVIGHLKQKLETFSTNDSLILNGSQLPIDAANFQPIHGGDTKSISFIDGGQAEIISAGNFCLSLIRVAALSIRDTKKQITKKEFFLLTTAKHYDDDIYYESKIFGDSMVNEEDLFIASKDASIKTGNDRAPISKVANMARRFAELQLAKEMTTDFIVLDGTLQPTFKNEECYLQFLDNVCAVAKSSQLFTTSGNSPTILLQKLAPQGLWHYRVNEETSFVKLHQHSKHVFRFEGNTQALPSLSQNSTDAIFLGYPYGLISVDKIARISEEERKSLKMKVLLNQENKDIAMYLSTTNAHDILDNLG